MLKIFKRNRQSLDDVIKHENCMGLLEKVKSDYGKDMTGLIVIIEKNKESFWHCAGMEPVQAILSLDQLHHRIQHEGLEGYD